MKALITAKHWFFGPDGRQYRGAFGEVKSEVHNTISVTTSLGTVAFSQMQVVAVIECETMPVTDSVIQ